MDICIGFCIVYFLFALSYVPRETREGWPKLTVETEANGDSRSTYERGPSLVVRCRYNTRDCWPALAALVGPVQNIFISFVPTAQEAGQAVVPGRLSLNMCL